MVIMKKSIIYVLMCVCALVSCTDTNVSDLKLNGDCDITAFTADSYNGIINKTARTVTVRVPESYSTGEMAVTALTVSDGAESDVKVGEKLNMNYSHVMHVVNGDVYLNWTISALRDAAKILSFKLNDTYTGIIDESAKTITVYVPKSADVTKMYPTITVSDNATVTPASGTQTDFTHPVTFTVTNNTASNVYTATVIPIGKPSVVFVGLATTMDGLNIEEQTACKWMLENVSNSLYTSFDDIKNGTVDLSECKVVWWHFHKDGGVDGKSAFEKAAPEALNAALKLKDYYNNGGSFLFTRFATNMPVELGAVVNDVCPNNCWGQTEDNAETVSSPWSFSITGHKDHALFQNLVMKDDEPNSVYTCDAGYRITNSTAQWHIGSDWGGYADYNVWRTETGGKDLAYGGDGAIVAWEFPASGSKGGIVCIGSGCYDWYSIDNVAEHYHANIAKMTMNAFNYLMNK